MAGLAAPTKYPIHRPKPTDLEPSFMPALGREALQMKWEFNRRAGFTEADDELPAFFYAEALAPSNKTQRHRSAEVNQHLRELLGGDKGGVG